MFASDDYTLYYTPNIQRMISDNITGWGWRVFVAFSAFVVESASSNA